MTNKGIKFYKFTNSTTSADKIAAAKGVSGAIIWIVDRNELWVGAENAANAELINKGADNVTYNVSTNQLEITNYTTSGTANSQVLYIDTTPTSTNKIITTNNIKKDTDSPAQYDITSGQFAESWIDVVEDNAIEQEDEFEDDFDKLDNKIAGLADEIIANEQVYAGVFETVCDTVGMEDDFTIDLSADSTHIISSDNNIKSALYHLAQAASSGGGGGSSTLDGLSDVDITSPSNNDVLKYDSNSGEWNNGPISVDLSGLGDVTITTPANNEVLKYNSSTGKWYNGTDVSGTDTTDTAGGDDTSSKIYLVGMTSQTTNDGSQRTYTQDTAYVGTDGCLYSGGEKVLTSVPAMTTSATSGSSSSYTWNVSSSTNRTYTYFTYSGTYTAFTLTPSVSARNEHYLLFFNNSSNSVDITLGTITVNNEGSSSTATVVKKPSTISVASGKCIEISIIGFVSSSTYAIISASGELA